MVTTAKTDLSLCFTNLYMLPNLMRNTLHANEIETSHRFPKTTLCINSSTFTQFCQSLKWDLDLQEHSTPSGVLYGSFSGIAMVLQCSICKFTYFPNDIKFTSRHRHISKRKQKLNYRYLFYFSNETHFLCNFLKV